jgi:hypothetical protein
MGSTDNVYEKDKISKKPGDPNKRDFTYFVLGGARFIYASAARLVALKVWTPHWHAALARSLSKRP